MTEILSLTVNGEAFTVAVTPRTQLAEVLRDHLDLTGTHLACEQGVCGACTVMMDGKPVRSCITFAHGCQGTQIETIEGYGDDPLMQRLRAAFSRHHALQCGFCTPGMLATSRDIIARFKNPDEATIRHELSGNLCRCTGYVGIVNAIQDVIGQGQAEATVSRPTKRSFTPFQPLAEVAAPAITAAVGRVSVEDNWTVIQRGFTLSHPPEMVWALFRDVATVAPCVPGAIINEVGPDTFSGAVEIHFGPIRARFGGSGSYENDDAVRQGAITGQGDDKNGKSKVRGQLHYTIHPGQLPTTSRVDVDFKFEIQGMLAQFNRPELVTGFVDFILSQFLANCDVVLSGGSAATARKLSFAALIWSVFRANLRRLFSRRP